MFLFGFVLLLIADVVRGQELRVVPSDDTFTRPLGSTFVFTCEVYHLGPQLVDITLQWFDKEGREIVDTAGPLRTLYIEKEEDSPTKKLYFARMSNEQAGTYSCSGIVGGNRQEQKFTLRLFKDITFDDAPSPQFPIIYTSALILCKVSGNPNPTVSWRYKGQKITATTSDRYSQDRYGLIIKNITKNDDGLYFCRAQVDADGRYDEKEINVIVNIPPRITTKSLNNVGIQSQEYVLQCKAIGLPVPKYDFTKDGNRNSVYSTDRIQVDNDAGEILYRPLHKEDEGVYTCRSYNNAGEDFEDIKLFVQIPPTVLPIWNVTQTEGLQVTLTCNSNGDPPPIMAFQKAGNAASYVIGDNDGGRIVQTNPMGGRIELLVKNLIPEDMSNYTCHSTNPAGYHERNGTITVNFKPRFQPDQIHQLYIWPGKLRNITCNVWAEPMPVIEWRRFEYPLYDNETFRVYHMGLNSNLQVRVREYDVLWIYGDYTCRARNQYGQSDTKIKLLKATIPDKPKSVSVKSVTSDLVELTVVPPDNNGGAEVTGFRIDYELRVLMFLLDDDILIENLRPSTTFVMMIRSVNEVGFSEPYTFSITTDDVRPPWSLELLPGQTGPYRYTIMWAKPKTGGRPIREYEFRFRRVDDEDNAIDDWTRRLKEDDEYRPLMYYILDELRQMTRYELEVRTRNDVGWSGISQQFFTTLADSSNPGEVKGGVQRTSTSQIEFIFIYFVACVVVVLIKNRTL